MRDRADDPIRARCFHPTGRFTEFPKDEVGQSIPERFEKIVRRYPGQPAVKTGTHALTYEELNHAANRVSHAVLNRGGPREEPVALLFENGAPFVISSVGLLKTGKIQVPLESTFPRARLATMLEQSGAGLIVTDTAHLRLAAELGAPAVINVDEIDDPGSAANPDVSVPPDAPAAIGYTSGSTGRPKGITWNHRGVLHAVMRHTNTTRMTAHDRLVMFRASLRSHLYALLNGATYYPVDLRRDDVTVLAPWLIRENVTMFRAAVSVFRSFAGTLTGAEAFPQLRLILLFGEPVYHADVEVYRKHFGKTAILASTLGCNEFDDYAYFFVDPDTRLTGGVVPGGYPIGDIEIVLLDADGRPVGADEIGEIAIRSRYNAVGYWRRPDLTEAAFLPGPAGGDTTLYHTGDVGRVGRDGCLFHLGRKDFQVKIRGHRVEVAEVEGVLLQCPEVKEAVVVGREDTPGDKRLVAYLVAGGAKAPRIRELRRMLADKLPDSMMPSAFVTLDGLPHTPTGKIDRRALPAPESMRPDLETGFVKPATAVEEKIATIWAEVLGLDRVGLDDDFIDLGGDSLLATRIISRVSETFQVRLPIKVFFNAPTAAEMAMAIVGSRDAGRMKEHDL